MGEKTGPLALQGEYCTRSIFLEVVVGVGVGGGGAWLEPDTGISKVNSSFARNILPSSTAILAGKSPPQLSSRPRALSPLPPFLAPSVDELNITTT